MADIDKLIEKYVGIRDRKNTLVKEQKEVLIPYTSALEKIENALLRELNASNSESAKTLHGTAFKVVKSNVKIVDWGVALDYLMENDLLHLLERRLAKTGVQEYVESNGENLPGTTIDCTTVVQIRRS